MKIMNILIGLVIFSVGLALMFSLTADILGEKDFESGKVKTFTDLSVSYESVSVSQTKEDSNIRDIGDATESGPASSDDTSVFLLTGAIQGGRLFIDSIGNFNNVVNNVTNTIDDSDNPSGGLIDKRIRITITAVFVIFIIIISIQFLRGFKLES